MPQCQEFGHSNSEEDRQRPREVQNLLDWQLLFDEEEEVSSSSSSSFSSSSSSSSSSISSASSPSSLSSSLSSSPPVVVSNTLENIAVNETTSDAQNSVRVENENPTVQSEEERDPSNPQEEDAGVEADPLVAQAALYMKLADLVLFILHKYSTKETISDAQMLNDIVGEHQEHFSALFQQACECVQLVFGIDVKEVDPLTHSYILTPILGLTYDGVTEAENSKPKTGLLVIVLGIIIREGESISEEEMWEALSVMGVYPGREHFLYGEPRELLTSEWVQEQYIVYQQVDSSQSPRYEFRWGPRAHAETSIHKVTELWFQVNNRDRTSFLSLPEGAEIIQQVRRARSQPQGAVRGSSDGDQTV